MRGARFLIPGSMRQARKNKYDLDSDSIERFLRMEAFSNGDKKLQGMRKNVQLY